MATKYCDHGIYAAPVAGGTVPTAAEDGNGAAKTAATMATMIVTFTGIPAAAEAITIAGVTFTAVASGATGNQFNAVTSAAQCATNLAAAINASTTNALKPVGAIATTAPLRNVVNACVSAGVITIYTRCAGAEWNAVTETSTLTNASITAQWSGGADGAWGYFFNTASLTFPTAQGVQNYGVYANARPYVGSWAAADKVITRSNKTLAVGALATGEWLIGSLSMGTLTTPARIVIDDGTEWPADGSEPVFTINWTPGQNRTFGNGNVNYPSAILAKKYSETSFGFVLNLLGNFLMTFHVVNSREYVGCKFTASNLRFEGQGALPAENAMTHLRECYFESPSAGAIFGGAASANMLITANFSECTFSNFGNASNHSGLFGSSIYNARQLWYFDSCKWVNYVSGSIGAPPLNNEVLQVVCRNCDFGNITVFNTFTFVRVNSFLAASSQFGYRDFLISNYFGIVEWLYARSMPKCNAKLLDGITPWVIHVVPSTTAGRNSRFNFVETPRIGKINSLASARRTLTIELAIHDALAWNKSKISAVVDYLDTAGNRQVIDTFDHDGSALDVSTATWTSESGGQVTYVDNSLTQYHNKYKFSVTTPTPIATDTEIGIVVRCHENVGASTYGIFIDPEIRVA